MALTHIFACVLLIVMSSLRVRSWRRWEEGAADGGGGAAAKGLSPAPPPAPSDASAAAAAAAAALEAGPSASAPAVEMGAAAAALGLGLSRKRVSFPEEIEGGRGAAAAAVAAGKKTAPATATTTTTTTAVTPSQRRRSVLLQRADKLDGFWPKLGEVGICILRQLLVLFPVTKREYLEMREAWMAAHGLDGSGAAAVAAAGGKGKEEGGCCCCCRESKDDGDGGDGCGGGGDGKGEKCCSCGCAASGSLPPICFADYVMKSFDDDVAGIVGLVKREFFLFLVRVRRRRKNLNLDLLSTSISTRFFFKRKKKLLSLSQGIPMWILLIVFLLLSDRIGWCIWVFLVVAGALLLALAVKLAWIVRYTSRARATPSLETSEVPESGAGAAYSLPAPHPPPPPPPPLPHDLDPSAFFFRRPWLMLPPIKLLLFFVSLVRGEEVLIGVHGHGPRCGPCPCPCRGGRRRPPAASAEVLFFPLCAPPPPIFSVSLFPTSKEEKLSPSPLALAHTPKHTNK